MITFCSKDLWTRLEILDSTAGAKKAAVGYVSEGCPLTFRSGDLLVLDASDEAIRKRKTSREFLIDAYNAGVLLYSSPGLHAKTIIFDALAYVGSANLSANSRDNLIEAGVLFDDEGAIRALNGFIDALVSSASTKHIDEGFIKRIEELLIDLPPRQSDEPPRSWILSVFHDQVLGTEDYRIAQEQLELDDDKFFFLKAVNDANRFLIENIKHGDECYLIRCEGRHQVPYDLAKVNIDDCLKNDRVGVYRYSEMISIAEWEAAKRELTFKVSAAWPIARLLDESSRKALENFALSPA